MPFGEHGMARDAIFLQVSKVFPIQWIRRKWAKSYYVTSVAHSNMRWAIVMSRNAGFVYQSIELDFRHPSEGHLKWACGGTAPDSACDYACTLLQVCLHCRVPGKRSWLARSGRHSYNAGLSACVSSMRSACMHACIASASWAS